MSQPVLTIAETQAAEKASAVDTHQLMENAGAAISEHIAKAYPEGRILILAGPGNNGGDGFVAARLLVEAGREVDLVHAPASNKRDAAQAISNNNRRGGTPPPAPAARNGDAPAAPESARAFAKLESVALKRLASLPQELNGYGLIVDALFGAGLNRPLAEEWRVLESVSVPLLAVDVPSGLHGDTARPLGEFALRATATLALGAHRPAHCVMPGRAYCGKVVRVDIGLALPSSHHTFINEPSRWALPRHTLETHKYDRGSALVLAGGEFATGAAELGAVAALRLGAGLVTLGASRRALRAAYALPPEIMRAPLASVWGMRRVMAAKRVRAVLLGPHFASGGNFRRTRRFVAAACKSDAALVLDADALSAFANRGRAFCNLIKARRAPTILTPHEGEFVRVFGEIGARSRLQAAREAASASGAVVVLKGADTIIAAPDGAPEGAALVNTNAPPALATAGSGDVLAGMVLGLLVQGSPSLTAASAAVWLHGSAGARLGEGLLAHEIAIAAAQIANGLGERGVSKESATEAASKKESG